MTPDIAIEHLLRNELKNIMPNVIWRNDHGDYEVFGVYKIIPKKPQYEVWCHDTNIGIFNSTKTALSWCIADKYKKYNLARELLNVDNLLALTTNDIFVRASIANKTKNSQFKEDIEIKLETKVIRKKSLEIQLAKCVNSAKYLQQRGFNNETARISRTA